MSTPDEADAERGPAEAVNPLAEEHHREHRQKHRRGERDRREIGQRDHRDRGEQQNMLAVPDSERSACERQFVVFSRCSPSVRQAIEREHHDRDQPAHEDRLAAGNIASQELDADRHAGEDGNRGELQKDPEDGYLARGGWAVHKDANYAGTCLPRGEFSTIDR